MTEDDQNDGMTFSRRTVLRAAMIGAVGAPVFGYRAGGLGAAMAQAASAPAAAGVTFDFNQGWRFGGRYIKGAQNPRHGDSHYARVTLPHTVTALSWGNWNPRAWEHIWIYRKHFSGAELPPGRVFLDFEGVLTNATVYLNGIELSQHQGGYLPWSVELTDYLAPRQNVLAVVVDSRWLDVPPEGHPGGPAAVDYLQPGGIYRDVSLRVVPDIFISDVFAKPTNVLSGAPTVAVQASINAVGAHMSQLDVTCELLDGETVLASEVAALSIKHGTEVVGMSIGAISSVQLWSPDSPKLYTVRTTLSGASSHSSEVTIGFREATFQVDGFYLNGERLQIFGLNRHQLFPYTGMAAPQRLQAKDAQLIRNELNCNMVRCSHYPQSSHFLDACDQVGLMVWEEAPGWKYMGNSKFQKVFLQNVRDMVVRDRNRPSVIVWGTRLDETVDYPRLYAKARGLAYALDGSRQTTGAMHSRSILDWEEDVFAYDDYHSYEGSATLEPPLSVVPYLVSEAVGALDGPAYYRWIDGSPTLQVQAQMHGEVHNIAASDPGYTGLLGWCAVDYQSLSGSGRTWQTIKWAGVMDTFRVAKPGASFYRSQADPAVTPIIAPAFFWDFGPETPEGPGPGALIATNCDALEIFVGGVLLTTASPATASFGSLRHPPVLVDLTVDGSALPELLIVGYVGGVSVTSLRMSGNPALDRLVVKLDDDSISGDGSDATRLTFRALDAYGNQRPNITGNVNLSISGPALLVAQNPFPFETYGGVGGGFIRSLAGQAGLVTVTASHPTLGVATGSLNVTPASGSYL